MKMVDISKITTETRNEKTKNIDVLTTREIVTLINEEDKKVAYAVELAMDQIVTVVDQITEVFQKGGRLIYIGAGTSGRLGVLDASECPPTYGVSPDMVVGIIAGGDHALRFAVESVEDSKKEAVKDLKNHNLSEKDILIGIAASGRTPYVIGALEYANSIGVKTACITTSVNSLVAKAAKYPIEAITGPEVVTGSTRMKSGTAQKMIANILTTSSMIKIGKVYENLMIDVKMSNEKLISRAQRIIVDITGVTAEVAMKYLKKYDSVKYAIFAIMSNIEEYDKIQELLEENQGNIRKSLQKIK
ncbi:N-acetylmuramic acid 6-phosphate etherase [Haploplasma axanthum]|uniref:N-acetylmuramic acid 6-phosphate etherase n=1 Tax=Haploplasma axanthum TaxID=29552 RepID=A0A449BD05_HAPAX|nr:N-acetylmuramic acid 6-phosphate etherase [Haploplasma axanthum]VEU80308.1 N-acetylmuramic acid 6-phosphate etherase [Haploplasma axanthum]